ncbi:hypothetical protein ACQEVF_57995 [Nonomuraea polychroma]|uniref:hypothetical protein n=1 Tax=Nonomuraea polychroma TaxID=46176 RepID=UPI003D9057AC
MPRLATCSFKEFLPEYGVPVRISAGTPERFRKLPYELTFTLPAATPPWKILKWEYDAYRDDFVGRLNAVGIETVASQIAQIVRQVGDADAQLVLLCFENLSQPSTWCHRTMFAIWWRAQTGEDVPELGTVPGPTALF